ncbi:MAG: helix-turn-helix transcriptional regulator [Candidatus Poribacteria bacterium]|nr:helix-turn-helix transcriptional regulator [Candidatus Poribacteria bacterium]
MSLAKDHFLGYLFVTNVKNCFLLAVSFEERGQKMRINPDRLRSLRKKQNLSIAKLAKKTEVVNPPGITEKTIQRLERQSSPNQTAREYTVECLAKALGVEAGVLMGELPLPDAEGLFTDDSGNVRINAQIGPKTRLAYDLIRKRSGVTATNLISMAPLFFALLASGSLAWRKEKQKGVKEAIECLKGDGDNEWNMFAGAVLISEKMSDMEDKSIKEADIFGEDLLNYFRKVMISMRDGGPKFFMVASDMLDDGQLAEQMPSQDEIDEIEDFFSSDEWREEFLRSVSPFAQYLKMLAREDADVVSVGDGDLWSRFPNYDVYPKYLNEVANNSPVARMALEFGHARLSEIPDALQLRAEDDAGEEREKWLKEKFWGGLHDLYGQVANNSLVAQIALEFGHAQRSEIPDVLRAEDAGEKREKWLKEKLPPDKLHELMEDPRCDVLDEVEREKWVYENWWKDWEEKIKKG